MNIKLILGNGQVDFDFESEADRDLWWKNMTERRDWQLAWAEKIGNRTIRMAPDKMPIHWAWPLTSA